MKFRALVLAATFALSSTVAALAGGVQIDKDQVSLPIPPKAAVTEKKATGSIGRTTTTMPNLWGDKCDPLPTAYDPYFGFCDATVTNVGSLSERSQGEVIVTVSPAVAGVPAQCVVTHVTGPWWNLQTHTHTQNC